MIDYGNGYHRAIDLNVMYTPEEEVEFNFDEMEETEDIPEMECETDMIAVTILSVVPGSKYTVTAISEIKVEGK